MPSPFPGMDPYLEQPGVWRDFHHRYVPAISALLNGALPDRYVAKVEEDVYLHERSAEERRLAGRPDAIVSTVARGQPTGGAAVVAPGPTKTELVPAVDVERIPYLELVDLQSGAVVTVIELLSPSNKGKSADRTIYLNKRQRLVESPANVVEIDLLRGGPRMPFASLPPCDQYVMVSRAAARPTVDVWPLRLRDRLPAVPVPLANGDADVMLDLRAALDEVYDAARYGRYIYAREPDPPLGGENAAWARSVLGR